MLAGQRIIVVGLGRSGIAVARLGLAHGARVLGTDSKPLDELPRELGNLPLELAVGGHQGVAFTEADLIVVSPGVPPLSSLAEAERAGVPVVGELEFACRFARAPMVVIGGTNGKSTTTVLVGGMLAAGGKRVFVGGNLGVPLAEVVEENWDCLVLEVSSFQLERAPSFHPGVSVLLNLTEDHLDRYPSFLEYVRAKGNAFVNQTLADFAIVPAQDDLCRAQAERGRGTLRSFGFEGDYALDQGNVVERATGLRFSLESAELHGAHNLMNAAAAVAAVRSLDLPVEAIARGLARFRPLPHRMAPVGTVARVTFYDDSKATNVGAAVVALRGLAEERGVLIAGGRDKLGSYAPLVAALREKGRALVLIGEASEAIARAVGDQIPTEAAPTLEEAAFRAYRLARPGDAVLLAPACSSFDMFKSYADRGDRFARAVAEIGRREAEEVEP